MKSNQLMKRLDPEFIHMQVGKPATITVYRFIFESGDDWEEFKQQVKDEHPGQEIAFFYREARVTYYHESKELKNEFNTGSRTSKSKR